MSYQPPYTINAKIIHLISAISEQVGVVQRDFLDASPQLRKANQIKTITGTLAIECIGKNDSSPTLNRFACATLQASTNKM